MIDIEFYDLEGDHETFFTDRWGVVPRIGEEVDLGGDLECWTVKTVTYGSYRDGNLKRIPNRVRVYVGLVK